MSDFYVGDTGVEITLDCGADISTASNVKIKVRKPRGSEVEWAAYKHGSDPTKIQYITGVGDFNEPGEYKLQAYLSVGAWTGSGETAHLTVTQKFE